MNEQEEKKNQSSSFINVFFSFVGEDTNSGSLSTATTTITTTDLQIAL